MGISASRLFDRRAYRGTIDGEYRMRSPSVASRSRTRGWRTQTGPIPVMISRSGRWPWRTTRCWPVSVFRSVCFARNSATSASTAWVSSARAPLRRISVRESVKAPGWASLMTLLSDTAYHSFIGEVEALNTTTIRRLTPSRRPQLLAIAQRIVRAVIKEIVVYVEATALRVLVHWHGGHHTQLNLRKRKAGEHRWKTAESTLALIEQLARLMSDQQIAAQLNRMGIKSAKGYGWTRSRVGSFRKTNAIANYAPGERQARGEFTIEEAAKRLGVSYSTV